MPKPLDHRARQREHDAKRRTEQPWRAWYKTPGWFRIRSKRLRDEPLCRMCKVEGRVTPGRIVDHIKRHQGQRELFFDYENTQTLCETHHNRDKQREERGRFQAVGEDGWPI